jgi:hypothetical protein
MVRGFETRLPVVVWKSRADGVDTAKSVTSASKSVRSKARLMVAVVDEVPAADCMVVPAGAPTRAKLEAERPA